MTKFKCILWLRNKDDKPKKLFEKSQYLNALRTNCLFKVYYKNEKYMWLV